MSSYFRFFVGRMLPGGYTTGIKGWLLKFFGEFVSFTARVFQGVLPLWREDPVFARAFLQNKTRIDMDQRRAHVLFSLARSSMDVPGKYAEVGSYRGGSAMLVSLASNNSKELYCFDTFEGFPDTTPDQDLHIWKKGEMSDVSLDDVKEFLSEHPVRFFKGIFPDTAADIPKSELFAFVHLDTDLYNSTLEGCRFFYSRLSSSGILLVDDYGMNLFPGVKSAVDLFEAEIPESGIYLPTGQYMFIKKDQTG
jgi:O-methyltransferase